MQLLDIVKKGSTDRSVTIRIIDATTGEVENAVEHDTSGLALWYRREGADKTSITAAALAALTTGHTDNGIELIGDGAYRLDLPDAAFASGANHVDIGGTVTGMLVIGGRVRLVDYNPEDTVRLGLTALPAAAANAANGLLVSTAGALDMDTVAANVAFIKQYAFSGPYTIDEVTSSTVIVLDSGPPTDIANVLVIISDDSNGGALSYAEGSYDQSTLTITLDAAAPITVHVDDTIVLAPVAAQVSDVNVTSMGDDVISAGAVSSAAASKIAAAVDVALINTGDGADLLQAIANQIAADWVAGDASPLAIVSALTANATFIQLVADASAAATALGTAGNGLSNVPWNAAWDAQVESECTDALAAYDPPTNAEMEARTLAAADYATATALGTVDTVVDATKVIADKLDSAMELDSTVYRFTTNALEQAPAGGGGGSSDWTADEKTVIRAVLGIPGSGTTPATPSVGVLDTLLDSIIALQADVDSVVTQTAAEFQAAAARAGVEGTWTDEIGGSFVLTITG